jgi:predicted dehydrogenase
MKVAIIGRGFGANAMKPAFEACGWQTEVVPSRDMALVEAACAGDADLIAVHSPPFQHQQHVMAALAQGKPVLCDKPFGLNAGEARAMRDAAKAAGVLHFLNFEMRCFPAWAKARALIREGAIGDLVHVSWSKFSNGLRVRDHGWLNDASLGGGWLGASGSHDIDALRFLSGHEVVACGGVLRTEVKLRPDGAGGEAKSTAEDAFSMWLEFAGGGTASVDSAFAAFMPLPTSFTLIGSQGAISIASDTSLSILRRKQDPEVIDLADQGGGGFMGALGTWVQQVTDAMNSGTQIAPNFDDGVAAAEVMDKIRATARRTGVQ